MAEDPRMMSSRSLNMRSPYTQRALGGITNFPQNNGGGYGMGGGGRSSQVGGGRRIDAHAYPQGTFTRMNRGHSGPLSPDYGRSFGGLNEFYQGQQNMGEWDRLQNRAQMDMQDAIGSDMARELRYAQSVGDMDLAEFYQAGLDNRLAQQMAAQGRSGSYSGGSQPGFRSSQIGDGFQSSQIGGSVGQSTQLPMYQHGETKLDQMGNTWAFNEGTGRGEMIETARMQSTPMQWSYMQSDGSAFSPDGGSGEATRIDPRYGVGTVKYGERSGPATFTTPSISRLTPAKTETSTDFFQNSANRQRTPNRFASPDSDFNGSLYGGNGLSQYADRMLGVKQKLGKA